MNIYWHVYTQQNVACFFFFCLKFRTIIFFMQNENPSKWSKEKDNSVVFINYMLLSVPMRDYYFESIESENSMSIHCEFVKVVALFEILYNLSVCLICVFVNANMRNNRNAGKNAYGNIYLLWPTEFSIDSLQRICNDA